MEAFGLKRYDAACKALAEAKAVDEAKQIRNVAEAMRVYARQAKNKQLEIDAAEIRIRAERRVGELMTAQRESEGLNKGAKAGRPPKNGGPRTDPPLTDSRPTLADAGIDKHLADRARKYAAVPKEQFEAHVSEWRGRVEQEHERVTTQLLKAGEDAIAALPRDPLDIVPDDIPESDFDDSDSPVLYHMKRYWRMSTKKDRKAFRRWIDESH